MANHNRECLSCNRNMNCELQKLCNDFGVEEIPYEKKAHRPCIDKSGCIVRDQSKCVLFGRCVGVCSNIQEVGVINYAYRGAETSVTTYYEDSLTEHSCINCGQCIKICPVGAQLKTPNYMLLCRRHLQ